jgi:hypothetical protein
MLDVWHVQTGVVSEAAELPCRKMVKEPWLPWTVKLVTCIPDAFKPLTCELESGPKKVIRGGEELLLRGALLEMGIASMMS